jgi:hypothetical protein
VLTLRHLLDLRRADASRSSPAPPPSACSTAGARLSARGRIGTTATTTTRCSAS